MEIVGKVAATIQNVLGPEAEELGRATGVIQRRRKFTAVSLLRMLVLTLLRKPDAKATDFQSTAAQLGLDMIDGAIAEGCKAMCVVAPTGSGKSRTVAEFIKRETRNGKTFLCYLHRRMLLDQTSDVFDDNNIAHGVIMSGRGTDWDQPVHVASVQSVHSWVKNDRIELPRADYIIVDEPHVQRGDTMHEIINAHKADGSIIISTTATPVGIKRNFDRLLIAATTPELIKAKLLVPIKTFSPSQPDLHKVKKTAVGEYVVGDVVKVMKLQSIVGNIINEYRRLNPFQVPTLLFGPDVASSRWCEEKFNEAGIPSAGIYDDTPDDERERIKAALKTGEIKVGMSRFCLREGVDIPEIKHLILATAFGAVSTFLQVVGRGMRKHPGAEFCISQDHGGNVARFGSPNVAQEWTLDDDDTSMAKKRAQDIQDKKVQEPIRCPKCGGERNYGDTCPHCGHKHKKSVRMIIQEDGELKPHVGNLTKIKRKRTEEEKRAAGMFFAAANGRGMTVGQLLYRYRDQYGGEFPDGVLHGPGGAVVLPKRGTMDYDRKVGALWPWAVRKRKTMDASGG